MGGGTAGGSGGGTGGGTGGHQLCGGDCTPVSSPVACGAACTLCAAPADLRRPTCSAGSCGSACITDCGGTCVDAQRDEANCGACGVTYGAGQTCSAGQCGVACATGGLFQPEVASAWASPNTTPWLVVADFTGDGRAEVARPSALLVSQGSGVLVSQALSASGTDGAAADMNRDGRQDLVVTLTGTGTTRVYFGTSTGLAAGVSYAVPARLVALADVDAVNGPDVVLLSATSTRLLRVMRNDGSGGLLAAQDVTVPTNVYALAVGDVTADGKVDAVVAAADGASTYRLLAYPGVGDGAFGAPVASALSERTERIALADVDRNGTLDVVMATVAASSTSPIALRWLSGSGAGAFSAETALASGMLTDAWRVMEVTGDGVPDLVHSNGVLSLQAGQSAGGFGAALTLPDIGIPVALSSGDVDADGDRDLVALNSLGSLVVTLERGRVRAARHVCLPGHAVHRSSGRRRLHGRRQGRSRAAHRGGN